MGPWQDVRSVVGVRHLASVNRSALSDLCLAAGVAVVQLPPLAFQSDVGPDLGPVAVLLAIASAASLLARRRRPVVLTLVLGGVVNLVPAVMVAMFVALYSVGVYARREAGVATWAVLAAATAVLQVVDDGADGLLRGPVIALAMGFPLAFGSAVVARRQLMAELLDRAERAEREQRLLADMAVADERASLARELHDVVAHRVSLMVLHAGALELAPVATVAGEPGVAAIDDTVEDKKEAALIGSIGRQALDELREMLDVLRPGGGTGAAAPLAPLPGLADIHELAAASRSAGLAVTVTESGDVGEVAGSIARTAFRIVQEALTNVHKHAPGAPVRVEVQRNEALLAVTVVNDRPTREPLDVPGGGHGLTGVRERVALVSGQVKAGPTPDGGWMVQADLPVAAS